MLKNFMGSDGQHASKTIWGSKNRDNTKKQKNGDIYIYERQTVYDPEKKYNRILNSKLIAKIPKGSEEMIPTHHRQAETGRKDIKKKTSPADRHIGMMDIIDFLVLHQELIQTCMLLQMQTLQKKPFRWQDTYWQQMAGISLGYRNGNTDMLCHGNMA